LILRKIILRVIGGKQRGRKLSSLRGAAIRPTADRHREAIFNILVGRIQDAIVLDLFAGTGALGIEALSRGASYCVFIDHYKDAISVIARNLKLCRFEDRSKIIQWDIAKNLNCIRTADQKFDLIFMDPPYQKNLVGPALLHLQHVQALAGDARIVVEHSPFETIPSDLCPFEILDQRKYGKTLVSFLANVI
jgi:16S rRNA (guanine966-N2)-methyltransferase